MKFSLGLGLFLAFFFICHVRPLSAQEDSKSKSTCPEYFNCGNLSRMRFPFSNLSHPSCGLWMVDCEAHPSPKLALSSPPEYWFDVKQISDSTVKLHDPFLQSHLDNKSCASFHYNILPGGSPPISFSIPLNITLYKCFINHEGSQIPTDVFSGYKNYDKCDHEDFTVYYPNLQYHHAPEVPIIPSDCAAFTLPIVSGYNNSKDTELFQLLTSEFDLDWHVSDDCLTCHNEGHVCRTDWSEKSRCANAGNGRQKKKVIIVATATFVSGFAILVILAYCFRRKLSFFGIWSKTDKFKNVEDFLENYGALAPKRYNYSQVKKMTNSFNIELGKGGYGCVYKGKLQDGSPVAIKILKELKGSGEEFLNEVASISRTSHINIVTLLGFCFQGRKRALVYEFMPNGSLEKYIYGGNSLTNRQLGWPILYKIAVGIARGLEYLHRGCNTRILHFDIKPHNILLDENFCPKISDFGLAKLCPQKESIVSIVGTRGTAGYIAPEVFCKSIGGVSHKSDVYSYGMMVLEMVGGRKNIDVGVDRTSEIYFPQWIYTRLDQGEELGLFGISNQEENELARKMVVVSLWCIQIDPLNRPSMSKVVEMLEGNLQALETPPKPFMSSSSRASTISLE